MDRFKDEYVDREARLSIGKDLETGEDYLSIPVTIRIFDYEEYYRLSLQERAEFLANPDAARAFAERCRAHLEDKRLIEEPGWNRGVPI